MPTTVNLQGTVAYGAIPLWILFLILISPVLKRIFLKHRRKKKSGLSSNSAEPVMKKIPKSVKEKYTIRLKEMLADYKGGKRSERESYQLLSYFLREFFNEYSGVDVTRKTLAEIRGVGNPILESLIEEFYACEFAPDAKGDIERAIKNTIDKINRF